MTVSVEVLKGLERKVTVSVPCDKIEEEVGLRLRNLVHRVNIRGFRPGKVPFHVVKQRYADSVREEVARDMVQPTLHEALTTHALAPVGQPYVVPGAIEPGHDFSYTAVF